MGEVPLYVGLIPTLQDLKDTFRFGVWGIRGSISCGLNHLIPLWYPVVEP